MKVKRGINHGKSPGRLDCGKMCLFFRQKIFITLRHKMGTNYLTFLLVQKFLLIQFAFEKVAKKP